MVEYLKVVGFQNKIATWLLFRSGGQTCMSNLKNGTAEVTPEMVTEALELAKFMHRFDGIEINRRLSFVIAVAFALTVDGVDKGSLEHAILQNPRAFTSLADVADCVSVLETVFNKRRRLSRVYLRHEYEIRNSQQLAMQEGQRLWRAAQRTKNLFNE